MEVDNADRSGHVPSQGASVLMLTPFGVSLRKIRLDRGLRLLDLANKLGQTSSFVSAVETGRKPIPRGYIAAIKRVLQLSPPEEEILHRAADRTRSEIDVDNLSVDQREIVAAFARKLDELPPDIVEEIKKFVFRSANEDTSFRRKRKGILVAPASTRILRELAEQVRSAFVREDQTRFPIMDVLEFRLPKVLNDFYLDVCSPEEMGQDEGRVIAGSNCIKLRQDVYERAWNESGRDRFTACHELGHFLLHRRVTLARVRDDNHPVYRDAEWQADTFAGALLLSSRHLNSFTDHHDAAAKCGMTSWAASVMWAKYQMSMA
jgi:transcriptional regulator with XRE-family HTH domain